MVRDDIERTEPTETPTVRSVTEATIRTSSDYNGFMSNGAVGDRRMLVASGRGVGLSVGASSRSRSPAWQLVVVGGKHLLSPIVH
jgi:hypothetical protein